MSNYWLWKILFWWISCRNGIYVDYKKEKGNDVLSRKKVKRRQAKNVCCQQYYGHSEIYKVFIFVKLTLFYVNVYGIISYMKFF